MKRGLFIVIEGIRSKQKLLQLIKLYKYLKVKGFEVVLTHEPTEGKIGKLINEYIANSTSPVLETLLFAADRVEHVEKVIKPALQENKIVITDRYYFSSLAYQGAQGLDLELVIFIDVEPENHFHDNIKENKPSCFDKDLEIQKKVRKIFHKLTKEENMILIDGNRTDEQVFEEIKEYVKRLVDV